MIKKYTGYILLILSLIYAIFIFYTNDINLKYFGAKNYEVIVNTDVPAHLNGKELQYDHNNYFIKFHNKYDKLELKTDKTPKYIEIFKGQKRFYGISDTKSNTVDLASVIGNNNKPLFDLSMLFILSLFMVPGLYTVAYLIFFAGLFLINPKRVDTKITLGIIILTALLIRLCGVFEYPFWIDEVFTINYANSPWKIVFSDACNPPFFYALSKLWLMIVPEQFARLISVFAGTGAVWSLFYLIKKRLNEKTALVCAVLMALSYWGIYYSQEYRCYTILLFLAPLCTLSMFNLLENQNKKNLGLYTLLSTIIVNTHLYGCLYVFGNYLYLLFKSIKHKLNLNAKLIASGLIVIGSFLPYFFISLLPNAILNKRGWGSLYFDSVLKIMSVVYTLLFVTGLLILFMFIFKRNELKDYVKKSAGSKDFLGYCIYIIISVFLMALVISMSRQIMYYRYFTIIYPFAISVIAIIISQEWKNKYSGVLLTFLVLINIIFLFKLNFPLSLRYKGTYDIIKFERNDGISDTKPEIVLDYLIYYHKYYKFDNAKVSLWREFLREFLNGENTQNTTYITSFEKDKQKFIDDFPQFTVIVMPNDSKLIRIEK